VGWQLSPQVSQHSDSFPAFIALALRGVTLPFLSGSCPESIERFSGDIQCSNPVGIRLVAASCAFKPALSLAIVAGNIPAPRTGLGSLLGVDVDYGHPGKGGLVFDE